MTVSAQTKESNLLATLTETCAKYTINVEINPTYYTFHSPAAVDVEHDEQGNLVGIGVYDGQKSFYFTDVTSLLSRILCSSELLAHNGKGDRDSLRQWGIPVTDKQMVWDTELISHIIDSSRRGYGLKKLAKEDLGIEYPSYDDIVGKKSHKIRRTLDSWPIEIVSRYNALDCFATYKLYQQQKKNLNYSSPTCETEIYFQDIEKPISLILADMENRGIRVDLRYLSSLRDSLEAQKRPLEEAIKNALGHINLNSPKQLLEALNAKEIYPQLKGKPSTDKRALESWRSNNIVSTLLAYGELDTLLSSFVYPYLARGTSVVHPFFNQCGTRTGRLSCSNPNLLQIPRRTDNGKLVRKMFIPREGMSMGDCDFGQIEPRVLAHLSKDAVLCKMFNDGIDFHDFTSQRLGITRDKAKVLNLSVGYRATFKSVQAQLGGTREEAQQQIDKWWSLFPALRRWQESLIYETRRSGFCTTLLGRRIKIDNLTTGNLWHCEAAERQLINNITQGSAAEIMKMAMLKISDCANHLSPSFGLLVQVYDELLFESPTIEEDSKIVVHCMENSVKLDVPLTVDCKTGANWASCH